jgi:hypothetical protein
MSHSSFVTVTRDVVIVVLSQEDLYHASLAQKLQNSIQQQAHEADQVGVCIRHMPGPVTNTLTH